MSREVVLDFRGVDPASSTPTMVHIPPGLYPFRIHAADGTKSKAGANMVTVTIETIERNAADEYGGRRLTDYFVTDPANGEPSFGMKRLLALFLALGLDVSNKNIKFPLDKLTGLTAFCDIYDSEMAESDDGKYPARTVSKIGAYFAATPSGNGTAPKASAPPKAAAAPVAVAEPEPTPEPDPEPTPTDPGDEPEDVDALFA